MRLFLSSYRAGSHPDKLIELFGKDAKVAIVTNAKDYKIPSERKIKVDEVFDFFSELGMKPVEIDLRKYFTARVKLVNLNKFQAVWMVGGNVFLLRRALKQAGLDKLLYDLVRKNEIIYGGESAGAIIAGPTLKYSEMEAAEGHDGYEDSAEFVAEGYQKEPIWEGLQFVDYVPVPHYKSGDYTAEIDEYIKRLSNAGLPHKKMTDEQAIMINGNKTELLK